VRRPRVKSVDIPPPVVQIEGDAVLDQHAQDVAAAARAVTERTVHQQLVVAGRAWLERRCSVVIAEMASQWEEPDVIGWQREGSTLIECKASRADYRADVAKLFRTQTSTAMGRCRYYLVPTGLVTVDELYPEWGLLEWNGRWVKKVREAPPQAVYGWQYEMRLLLSALRRIGGHVQDGDGCSVWAYKFQTKKRAVLGTDQTTEEEE
jgi:hypothetical protein